MFDKPFDIVSTGEEVEYPDQLTLLLERVTAFPGVDENIAQPEASWEKAENHFGSVEFKRFKAASPVGEAVVYIPPLGGEIEPFEKKYIGTLLEKGYDVITLRRNGTILSERNHKSVGSTERIMLAQERGERYIGGETEYGYKEWVDEFACAMVGLANDYEGLAGVGSSFGGLIGLESLRQLAGGIHDQICRKIKTFISLSGQIGHPIVDATGYQMIDPVTNFTAEAFQRMLRFYQKRQVLHLKDPKAIVREYFQIADQLYAPECQLPASVRYVLVSAEGDQLYSHKQVDDAATLIRSNGGTVSIVHNALIQDDPHAHSELSPEMLFMMIKEPEKLPAILT